MHTAYIKFNSEVDRVRGFQELATHFRVTSLPGMVYAAPLASLDHLDALHISYRRASDEELIAANGQIRNPVAAVL